MTRRVVITGMGVVSALGCDLDTSWQRLHTLKNAVKNMPDLARFRGLNAHLAAPVTDFVTPEHYTRKVLRTMGPISVMALNATEQALAAAHLIDSPEIKNGRTGVAYGSSFGSMESMRDFYSMVNGDSVGNMTSSTYLKIMPQTTSVNLSVYFGTTGRLVPTGTACTSGSLAVGSAYELIRAGIQDIMIAGGAEEYNPTHVATFDTMYATSTKNDTPDVTPAPFDANRDGLVIGEGAGTLILEEYEHACARGADIFAEVVGFNTNTDGTHITNPNAQTMEICIRGAIKDANLAPQNIGYINAHGTATQHGDIAESTATANIFGATAPISSFKSYTGHTLGACGALESIWTILSMRDNWFAPTLNLNTPDPKCGELDYIMHTPRTMDTEFVMNNNFAFGGINTSLIFKKI